MSRNALHTFAAFALLCISTVSAVAQTPATAAQKFSLRNPLGETITLTSPASGVTSYSLTFPSSVPVLNSLYYAVDGSGQIGALPPGTNGQVLTYTTLTGLTWTSVAIGSVTNFVSGNLSPLFTTSVLTPTTVPTLSFDLTDQAANVVFAGPVGGGAADPTFRSLVAADIPSLNYVSSVALGNMSPLFTTTNAGTALAPSFTFAPVSQAANLVYASPSGGAGNPTFRALTSTDIPALPYVSSVGMTVPSGLSVSPGTITSSGTFAVTTALNGPVRGTGTGFTTGATSLTSEVSGILPIANGGTGLGTLGSAGQVLTVNAGATALEYTTPTNGTVTSVGLSMPTSIFDVASSPITSSGTLAVTFDDQTGNTVFASPANGSSGQPTFRSLVAADVPSLNYVSSVALGNMSPLFTTTNAGTALAPSFTFAPVSQAANLVYASPSGGAGNPTFRALTSTDIPALPYVSSVGMTVPSGLSVSPATITSSGTFAVTTALNGPVRGTGTGFTTGPTSLTSEVSGILPIANGGTGLGTLGTAGQILAVNAGATALEYVTPATGTVTNFSAGDLAPLFTTSEATTTTTPALSFNLNSQTGNTVFASPADGSSGAPLFRSLVAADVPALPYVSSVGLALPGSVFSVSGSPVTGSGTLTGSFTSQAANTVFAAPDGLAGTPTFRALTGSDITGAALTTADDANVTLTLGGSPATALLNGASITAGWNGQLSIARGGTGASTAPDALNNLLPSQAGNAGEFLTTDGAGNVSWAAATASGAWNTTGNTGTTAGTNFIGTTDNVDFVVKTNNAEALRVDATGQTGFGRTTPDAKIDLDGGMIWRPDTLDLTLGATHSGGANIRHDNLSIGDRTYFYVYDTATFFGNRVTGFTDGYNGKLMRIFNTTNTTLTLMVDDANSSAANRIRNPLGDNGNVGIVDSGFADLIYDGVSSRWIIHSVSGPTSTAASGFTYFARKLVDQTLTDASHSTTLQSSGMTVNIFPDIVHTVDGMLYFSCSNSNTDVKIAFDLPNGFEIARITALGHSDGGTNVVEGSDILDSDNIASETFNVSASKILFIQLSGMFINGPSNGTLTIKFARANGGGGTQDLTLLAGSYIRLIPVGVD